MSLRIVRRNGGTVALLLLAIGGRALPAAAQSVPNPVVTGPIEATATPGDPSHNYPFFSTNIDLASVGYIEEEYFFEGTASRYDIRAGITVADTPMSTARVIEAGVPYRTRMVVRRPASADKFNGTVLMEWQNVTSGYDFDAVWLASFEHIMRRGYAWIGVSAQRKGLHQPGTGLIAWSSTRYGTLDLTAAGTRTDDSLQYDVFSQAGQAIRHPQSVDPMAGLHVQRIIAVGVSQGALRLVDYHNAVHPLAGVFDAFIPILGGGFLRTDLGVKVFKVLCETDIRREQLLYRQSDSDEFRRWEVAGTAHFDFRILQQVVPLQTRDLGFPQPVGSCAVPPFSRIPLNFVANAALDRTVEWIDKGIAPSTAPEIETINTPDVIARDDFGNALGGIRLSQHAVPTATNTGWNGPGNVCVIYGSYVPFNDETLDALYPDHGTYMNQVARVAADNLRTGYIVVEDAAATIREAAASNIGKR